jgi:hypothetical protein
MQIWKRLNGSLYRYVDLLYYVRERQRFSEPSGSLPAGSASAEIVGLQAAGIQGLGKRPEWWLIWGGSPGAG